MNLRNVQTGSFQDSRQSWPPVVDLEGFRYERLGGLGGDGRDDMRRRSIPEWADWLDRDQVFSLQPYVQLGSVLLAAGQRDAAEAILFAGHERERDETWRRDDAGLWRWLTHNFVNYTCLTIYAEVAGYGIGLYTFMVLKWVIVLSLIGTFVLKYSPAARKRHIVWRFFASLHRLLPVIELSKEFVEFFDNKYDKDHPTRNLSGFPAVFFSGLALVGWILGFFLLAAMGGLAPK